MSPKPEEELTALIDNLLIELSRASRGTLLQPVIAAWEAADYYRDHLRSLKQPQRVVVRMAQSWWRLHRIFGVEIMLRISMLAWSCFGLLQLAGSTLRCGPQMFTKEGQDDCQAILVRTGVANEPVIRDWLNQKHSVTMVEYNVNAPVELARLSILPVLMVEYFVQAMSMRKIIAEIDQSLVTVLMPIWLVRLARRLPAQIVHRYWVRKNIRRQGLKHLYFTMNSTMEAAFIDALDGIDSTYIEHGYPRRDIPPLVSHNLVYGTVLGDYLRMFDGVEDVEIIGTRYFNSLQLATRNKVIVIASLQDWPQWGVKRVAEKMNVAIGEAAGRGWKLVYRGRHYGNEDFLQHLSCQWDEFSEPADESFAQCLERLEPAMVWTTWSTAVLDASAMGVRGVCFIDEELENHFLIDAPNDILMVDVNRKLPVDELLDPKLTEDSV
jgi:hypothetical protein